jgi:hypothetical protein
MGIGIICLLGKLHKWDESAVWFDGSSLGMTKPTWVRPVSTNYILAAVFVFAIGVYLSVTIPALKAVVNPAEADSELAFDQNLGLLGAGNTIIAGLLVLILVMQARHTVVGKAANEAQRFSCSGRTRVREACRGKGAGCVREGKDQGGQVGVNSRCTHACNLLHSTSLSLSCRAQTHLPCILGPTQFSGYFPGAPQNRFTSTHGCLSFKTRSREEYRFLT